MSHSQSLASYWSHVQNIRSPWRSIGHTFGVFSVPGFLLVTHSEYRSKLTEPVGLSCMWVLPFGCGGGTRHLIAGGFLGLALDCTQASTSDRLIHRNVNRKREVPLNLEEVRPSPVIVSTACLTRLVR
jgi:hypothetical protein